MTNESNSVTNGTHDQPLIKRIPMKSEFISIIERISHFQFSTAPACRHSIQFAHLFNQLLRVDGWFPNCISGLREPHQSRLTFTNHLGFLSSQLCTIFVAYFGNTVSATLTSSLLVVSSRQTFLMRLVFTTWALTSIQANLQALQFLS